MQSPCATLLKYSFSLLQSPQQRLCPPLLALLDLHLELVLLRPPLGLLAQVRNLVQVLAHESQWPRQKPLPNQPLHRLENLVSRLSMRLIVALGQIFSPQIHQEDD